MATEQNKQPIVDDTRLVTPEPGRRYSPARIRPRMGADIRRSAPLASTSVVHQSASQTVFTAVTEVVPRAAILRDVVQHKPVRNVATTKPAQPRQHKSLVLKRTIITKAQKHQKQTRDERKQQLKAFLLGGTLAVLVVSFGAGIFLNNHQQNSRQADSLQAPQALGVSTSQGAPDEATVSNTAVADHTADPDAPRVLRIMRLGVNARIASVGTNLKGDPEQTSNIYDVGWLSESAKPGAPGVTVLNGYVAGTTQPGAFAGISTLLPGDILQLERGDGSQVSYVVARSQIFPADKVDMKAVATSPSADKSGLSLVSNTGRFNVRTGKFEDRTVVWAVQQ